MKLFFFQPTLCATSGPGANFPQSRNSNFEDFTPTKKNHVRLWLSLDFSSSSISCQAAKMARGALQEKMREGDKTLCLPERKRKKKRNPHGFLIAWDSLCLSFLAPRGALKESSPFLFATTLVSHAVTNNQGVSNNSFLSSLHENASLHGSGGGFCEYCNFEHALTYIHSVKRSSIKLC